MPRMRVHATQLSHDVPSRLEAYVHALSRLFKELNLDFPTVEQSYGSESVKNGLSVAD